MTGASYDGDESRRLSSTLSSHTSVPGHEQSKGKLDDLPSDVQGSIDWSDVGETLSADADEQLSSGTIRQGLIPISQPTARARPYAPPMKPQLNAIPYNFTGDEYSAARSEPTRPSKRHEFEIAIICALPIEYDAVSHLFDQFWDKKGNIYMKTPGDQNTYATGRIGKFNVVLVLPPGMGTVSTVYAAANLRSSYLGVQLALLVGICGGVPKDRNDNEILLGDVIISDSIVQYDFARYFLENFVRKNTPQETLGRAIPDIRGFVAKLQIKFHLERLRSRTAHQHTTFQTHGQPGKFKYPGMAEDKLFESSYQHKHGNSFDCDTCFQGFVCEDARTSLCTKLGCDESLLVQRKRLESKEDEEDEVQVPGIHFGPIVSGDTVMKSSRDRDMIAEREGVIGFNMERANIWDNFPFIAVKGVCDYADSHRNKKWQGFAAATAASAAKALLEQYHIDG
ncbi:hypothetical protein ABW20_dc0104852 [Dactylellina cionopaga]|nr:hypothetical protein ABW20_dc0104852 [Dactylellina cionopaga]